MDEVTFIRYNTGVDKDKVGNGHFQQAIAFISATLTEDTRACKTYVRTVVICLCEGARFKPLFYAFKKNDWGFEFGWMWDLIQNWEKISAKAREERKTYVAPKVLNYKVMTTLIKNSGWCADNLSIQHRHQKIRKSSEQASTSSQASTSTQQTQGQKGGADAHALLCVTNVKDLFRNALLRSGLSHLHHGQKLKISEDQVVKYETGKDKRSPNIIVLRRLKEAYSLKLDTKRS